MRIECGPNRGRITRLAFMSLLVVIGAGWFAYDGWIGYAAENRAAIEALGATGTGQLEIDPRIDETILDMNAEERRAILSDITPIRSKSESWYFGPYHRLVMEGDTVVRIESTVSHSSQDILVQRILAVALGPGALIVVMVLLGAGRQRVVADENGLTPPGGGAMIPWSAVRNMDGSRWRDKGWVTLHCDAGGREKTCRLDSYHLDNFDALLDVVCRHANVKDPRGDKPKIETPNQPSDGAPDESA